MRATRRQFLFVAGSALALTPALAWIARPTPAAAGGRFPIERSDDVWRRSLTPTEYSILRNGGTERPFSSPLDHEARRGTFACAGCGRPTFSSTTKYDSGTGWPSFWAPLDGAVATRVDTSWFMVRSEVHCAACGSHLGHLFDDGPRPTGLRYCINGLALRFEAA